MTSEVLMFQPWCIVDSCYKGYVVKATIRHMIMHIYTQAYREVRCFVGKLLEEGCLKLWPDGDNEEEKMGRFV